MSVFRRFSAAYYRNSPEATAATNPPTSNSSTTAAPGTPAAHAPQQRHHHRRREPIFRFSPFSVGAPSDGAWCATDFMLGVGMIIIQPSTGKIVVCHDKETKDWFFPKGRKDVDEKSETAALREAYEESGYRAELLPLYIPSNAPASPDDPRRNLPYRKTTEPIFVYNHTYNPTPRPNFFTRALIKTSRVYIVQWYVGQIPADAVREENTGMPDEVSYTSYLLSYQDAMQRVDGTSRYILRYAFTLFCQTREFDAQVLERERSQRRDTAQSSTNPRSARTASA